MGRSFLKLLVNVFELFIADIKAIHDLLKNVFQIKFFNDLLDAVKIWIAVNLTILLPISILLVFLLILGVPMDKIHSLSDVFSEFLASYLYNGQIGGITAWRIQLVHFLLYWILIVFKTE